MTKSRRTGGPRIALLVARFNSMITGHLERAARGRLVQEGIAEDRIESFHVPGAWDLPQAARWIASRDGHDALIAIGCVIRGETAHFDHVAGHASDGLGRVALDTGTPVVFGVLTTDNAEQALARALPSGANKGAEFAESALTLLALRDSVRERDER